MPIYLLAVHSVEGQDNYMTDAEMQQAFEKVSQFNDKLQAQGAWVFGGGLEPHDTATVVDARGGEVLVTDGPFAEAKEHLGGFWVITAGDLDAAMTWAREASVACAQPVEVRPFQGDTEV